MTDPNVAIARLEERVENLEEWQREQNGHLRTIDKKLDGLKTLLIGLLGGVITTLIGVVAMLLSK